MKKVMGYRLWVIGLIIFLSFLQTGCSAQIKDNPTDKPVRQWFGSYSQSHKLVEMQDPYPWDFGQVKEGEVLEHTFVLKNESEKTLTIKEVNTSCGCTTSKLEKKVLLPGESAEIEVKFNTKGYSGLTQQYVYVHTDSLDKPIIRFIIKAEVMKSK